MRYDEENEMDWVTEREREREMERDRLKEWV